MDDLRVGRSLRALRRRRRLRQQDLGAATGLAQSTVSLIERGHLDKISIRALRRVFAGLEADLRLEVRWRGGALDRLLDERHAVVVGLVANRLRRDGWQIAPEVTFSHFGERGSIDVLAAGGGTGVVLVVEVKTELTSIEETLRRHDVKLRLARGLAAERFGCRPRSTSCLLVLLDSTANRARVARHEAVLSVSYPMRGMSLNRWLRDPAAAADGVDPRGGLLFLRLSNPRAGMHSPDRVRVPGRPRAGTKRA